MFLVLSRVAAVAVPPRSNGQALPPGGSLSAVNAALQALSSSGGASSSDGAVTSIDISPSLDMLIVGFFSGRITLFDVPVTSKAAVLKTAELHRSPVSVVRFVSSTEPCVLSVRKFRVAVLVLIFKTASFFLCCRLMRLVLSTSQHSPRHFCVGVPSRDACLMVPPLDL